MFGPLTNMASVRSGIWILMLTLATQNGSATSAAQVSLAWDRSQQTENSHNSDVIVHALPMKPYPVKVVASLNAAFDEITSRQAAADAKFFSRCVTARDNKSLRELIDGQPYRGGREAALDRIIIDHQPCYPGYIANISMINIHHYGDCNPRRGIIQTQSLPICQALYDRGALVEKIISTYAPNADFTSADLSRAGVVARFRAREERFDRTRPKEERLYAKVVSCLVAKNPSIALAYERSVAGTLAETRFRDALIGIAPECVGGARQVEVDPSQFRIYLADAIYAWLIALRDVDSLIPKK